MQLWRSRRTKTVWSLRYDAVASSTPWWSRTQRRLRNWSSHSPQVIHYCMAKWLFLNTPFLIKLLIKHKLFSDFIISGLQVKDIKWGTTHDWQLQVSTLTPIWFAYDVSTPIGPQDYGRANCEGKCYPKTMWPDQLMDNNSKHHFGNLLMAVFRCI